MQVDRRLVIVPRWAGRPESDWYTWLQTQLAAEPASPFTEIVVADLPAPEAPTIAAWRDGLLPLLGADAETQARTVLMGHSVGCQAILRALEQLPAGHKVDSVLCIAGWWAVDKPWDSIVPWIETPLDIPKVRQSAGYFSVLLSDNDPFTADSTETKQQWERLLDASVTIAEGSKHFNEAEEPAVLEALYRHLQH